MSDEKKILLKKLGERVKMIRLEKNLTQVDLASLASKDQQSIQRLESGNINPSFYYLNEISKALSVNLKDLIDFS